MAQVMLRHDTFKGAAFMTPRQILLLNASFTAVSAVAMLVARSALAPLFGLSTPRLLDAIAVSLVLYAVALVFVANRRSVSREVLLTFAIADGVWVAGSAVVLFLFWAELAPIARALVILAAVVVDGFAMLQYRAAGASGMLASRA
jgi:hypothetical protein